MSTQPRINAPIGRLQIKTSETRKRGGSGVGRWSATEPPRESEMAEAEEVHAESTHPSFYPFPLRARYDDDP